MKRFIFMFAAFAVSVSLHAQKAVVDKIMDMALNDNQTMEHLDVLCNRIGGRPIGSDAYDNAAEWALKKFREWGLDACLEEAGELAVGFNRGPWFGRVLGGDMGFTELYFTTPSYTSGTRGVQRGHVILEPRTMAEFDRVKGALKGAWVLLEAPSRGWAIETTPEADRKREDALKANEETAAKNREIMMKNRREGTDEPLLPMSSTPCVLYRQMVDAGVLGFIQSSKVPITTLYDKGVAHNPDMTLETLPSAVDIKLDEKQFKEIKRMVTERRDVYLEFDIRNHFRMGPVKYHNVVACIKGSRYPDESVILSGHLDAFDVATGGVDCGSGCSAVMEAARMIALSGAKPERTMYFILFAGEEFGLLGAQAWVKAHPERLDGVSNVFNRDGGPLAYTSFSVPASLVDEFEKISEPLREAYPDYGFTINALTPRHRPESIGGTDASVFAIQGIPAVGMRETDVKGYDFQYREIWHTERDTYTESIPEYQEQAAAALAIIGLGTANLDGKFPRDEVYKD